MLSFFVIGGTFFWVILFVIAVLVLTQIEYERYGTATVIVILTFVGLQLFTHVNPLEYIKNHPTEFIGFAIGYFLIGALWSIAKWWLYCLKASEKYSALRDQWIKTHAGSGANVSRLSQQEKERMINSIKSSMSDSYGTIPPVAADNKAKVYVWITYWPLSLVWTLINDPIRKITKLIYANISSTLQRISNHVFANHFTEIK